MKPALFIYNISDRFHAYTRLRRRLVAFNRSARSFSLALHFATILLFQIWTLGVGALGVAFTFSATFTFFLGLQGVVFFFLFERPSIVRHLAIFLPPHSAQKVAPSTCLANFRLPAY